MVRRRSVEKWLEEEVWKDGEVEKCGKMVRRRSKERWFGEKLRKDG